MKKRCHACHQLLPSPSSQDNKICKEEEGDEGGAWEEKHTYLRTLNPLPGDEIMRFSEEGHKYNVRDEKTGEWKEVASAGSFLDTFSPEFPGYIVVATRKTVNERYAYWKRICDRDKMFLSPKAMVKLRDYSKKEEELWPEKYEVHLASGMFRLIYEGSYDIVRAMGYKVPHIDGEFTDGDIRSNWVRDGLRLHSQIEAYLNKAEVIPDLLPGEREPSTIEWRYFKQFLADHPNWEIFRTELNVYLKGYDVCGRVDAIFRDKVTGQFIMVDWKHTKNLKFKKEDDSDFDYDKVMSGPFHGIRATTRNKYFIKKNIYRIAAKISLDLDIDSMYLLVLHRHNPNYILIRIPIFSETKNQWMYERIVRAMEEYKAAKSQKESTTPPTHQEEVAKGKE